LGKPLLAARYQEQVLKILCRGPARVNPASRVPRGREEIIGGNRLG
jgi:hypothetical protein